MTIHGPQRVIAVIQARMRSSRLPGKVLMPLLGEPMLARIIRRVSTAKYVDLLVVATSVQSADDPIEVLCEKLKVPCHRGSEDDVLQRFLDVASIYNSTIIVRLTADNPLVDGTLVDLVLNEFYEANPKIVYANNIDEAGFPFGLYAEVVDVKALRQSAADRSAENCEHVTWHIRNHPDIYPSKTIRASGRFPVASLSIDTREDYVRVAQIFKKMSRKNSNFTYRDLMII